MIGQYENVNTGGTVTISPAVPGAQYRITAWALIGDGRRSATPAVVYANTGSECIRMQTLMCACAHVCVCVCVRTSALETFLGYFAN